jgi:hypothetical protein
LTSRAAIDDLAALLTRSASPEDAMRTLARRLLGSRRGADPEEAVLAGRQLATMVLVYLGEWDGGHSDGH